MRKQIFYTLILLLSIYSCAKDQGCYTYKDVNTITVKGLPDVWDYANFKQVYVGERLQMIPEIVFKFEEDTVGLKYIWTLDFDTVAYTRNLDLIVNRAPKKPAWGSYRILDTKVNVEYIFKFYLEIKANYENGWMFLCEKTNGRGQFNFFRPGDKEEKREDLLVIDGYMNANDGEELSEKPIAIRHHFMPKATQDRYNQVSIVCAGGPYQSTEIDGVTLKKVIHNKDEFIGGKAPQNFAPMFTFNGNYGYCIMSGGKLYTRKGRHFQEGLFINFPARPPFPLKEDYELSPIMITCYERDPFTALLFDKKNSAYMLSDGDQIVAIPSGTDTIKAFDPFDMQGKQLVAIGRIREEYYAVGGEMLAILQNPDGKFTEQGFFIKCLGYGGGFETRYEKPFPGSDYFSSTSKFVTASTTSYAYFTSGDGKKLYSYNFETEDVREIKLPFSGQITAMNVENNDRQLILGINNNGVGDIYWISVEIGQEGSVARKILGKMGKVVAIEYKTDSWY